MARKCIRYKKTASGRRCAKYSGTSKGKKTLSGKSKKRSGCKLVTIKGRKAKMCWKRVKVKKGSSKTRWGRVFVKAA